MSANNLCSEAIRRTLAQRAGGAPDASAIAEAVFGTWCLVADRLAPVIGAKGVDILFRRALHLTSKTFPWLGIVEGYGNSTTLVASLKGRFQSHGTAVAMEAGAALLGTFTELLTNLLGSPLTERLLGPVWLPLPREPEQETSP